MFCLDTNVFIQAHRYHYPMDVVPGFWDSLVRLAQDGQICSIEEVRLEIENGEDEVSDWVQRHPFLFLPNSSLVIQEKFADVAEWVHRHPQYFDFAKQKFLNDADPWLIAYALAHNCVVVTEERQAPQSRRDIKIPDVCQAMNVPYINTITMLRSFHVRLIASH